MIYREFRGQESDFGVFWGENKLSENLVFVVNTLFYRTRYRTCFE
nr:MAG TPA: hypothetical protein [Caudoviricetes sp.]